MLFSQIKNILSDKYFQLLNCSSVLEFILVAKKKTLGCVQTDATTPNIVAPTMLGVVGCVLAVVCKRMQQLPTMLGPAVYRGKDTTHKSL